MDIIGRRRIPKSETELHLKSLLVPCHYDDAVFLKGVCVHCIQHKRYSTRSSSSNKNCSNFIREKIYNYVDGQLVVTSGMFILFDEKGLCSRGVGCLKNGFEQLEAWRIAEGATFLKGRKIQIVTLVRHPFVKVASDGSYTGVCFEFMNAIRDKYNFSMQIFLPYDGNWGAQTENGSWNGMVGQVLRGEADVGVAGFSVTLQRSQVIAFSSSYYQEETAILIPPPREGGPKLTILIRPLSDVVWACLLITVLVLAPTFYLMHVASLYISRSKKEKKSFIEMIAELLHFMIGSLVQESVVSPVNKTSRFLIMLWWFLTLNLANIYVAYLVSYLSAPKLTNVVDSLEDLVKQNKIRWTFRQNTAHQSLFKSDTSAGVYKSVGDGVSIDELVMSDEQGIVKVLSGKFAFIKEKSFLDVALGQDFRATKGLCRMTVAKNTFFKVETALILPKTSKFLDLINTEITRAVTTGLLEKWKSLHWEQLLWCVDAVNYIPTTLPPTRKLELSDLSGAWFLLGCGAFFSIADFLIELCYSRIQRRGRELPDINYVE
ncbi:glutamate receptor ionotropic, delta-1-like [Folsomia candida]|uniref:glutamate receptor ionotropic, delta-1-like n=1 Tax=Folsomia candida TaxID=158441 RepID=UPI001604BD5C|nr:glutamate receptor ionotropic, delta-1-like [Folsomia candida]